MKKSYLAVPFELKAADDKGVFSGYANVFDVLDSDHDIVQRGAFARTLGEHKAKGTNPKMLWQHDYKMPIGVWDSMQEDDHGLLVSGRLAVSTTLGKDTYELLKMGAVDSMSIGYLPYPGGVEYRDSVSHLKALELWEVSIVTFPANDRAVIENVKRQIENGEIPNPSVLEQFLREAGLSGKQAKAFMSLGYKGINPREAEDQELVESLKRLAEKFNTKEK